MLLQLCAATAPYVIPIPCGRGAPGGSGHLCQHPMQHHVSLNTGFHPRQQQPINKDFNEVPRQGTNAINIASSCSRVLLSSSMPTFQLGQDKHYVHRTRKMPSHACQGPCTACCMQSNVPVHAAALVMCRPRAYDQQLHAKPPQD